MWWRQLLAKYAFIFVLGSFGSFVILVTLAKNLRTPIFIPGDIVYQNPNFFIYLPFGTSIILGLCTCFAVEFYYILSRRRWHS